MNKELVNFAEEVRRRCIDIMAAASDDGTDPFTGEPGSAMSTQPTAYDLAAELCQMAANVANREQMANESQAQNRYDLATFSL